MDGRMNRHTDLQRETIISRHYCVVGYKKVNQKVNLRRCPTIAILKDFFSLKKKKKKPVQKKYVLLRTMV